MIHRRLEVPDNLLDSLVRPSRCAALFLIPTSKRHGGKSRLDVPAELALQEFVFRGRTVYQLLLERDIATQVFAFLLHEFSRIDHCLLEEASQEG